MVIEPYILLPISAFFTILMILFIRLIAGARNAVLTENKIRSFVAEEETNVPVRNLLLSQDNKYALVELDDKDPLRLIRTFGDKLVSQTISLSILVTKGRTVSIVRQDFSHPAISFDLPPEDALSPWAKSIIEENKLGVQS
ncbi:MAG: hypothetical protein JKY12_02080 [Sneathiella sp.]|nr:hypothetical protein [Sneathiella sp.]